MLGRPLVSEGLNGHPRLLFTYLKALTVVPFLGVDIGDSSILPKNGTTQEPVGKSSPPKKKCKIIIVPLLPL